MMLPKEVTPDEGNHDLDGYFCINTDDYVCPCRKRPWKYYHWHKKIVVWPTIDEDTILQVATELKVRDLNPKIVEYNATMGKAITWNDIPAGATVL